MPPDIEPMLGTSGIPPNLDAWVAEPKLDGWVAEPQLDGWRARIPVDHDGLNVRTRAVRDITSNVHGLEPLAISGVRAVLDAELIAGSGRPSNFYRVGPTLARCRPIPGGSVAFVAFDVLWHERELITRRPYQERRAIQTASHGRGRRPHRKVGERPRAMDASRVGKAKPRDGAWRTRVGRVTPLVGRTCIVPVSTGSFCAC